jgi:hypothetical protein
MSWNKRVYSNIYRRYLEKFTYQDWLHKDREDENYYQNWLWNLEMRSYDDWGAPKSIEQLNQYKLLTLLGRLNIKAANKLIDDIGWY